MSVICSSSRQIRLGYATTKLNLAVHCAGAVGVYVVGTAASRYACRSRRGQALSFNRIQEYPTFYRALPALDSLAPLRCLGDFIRLRWFSSHSLFDVQRCCCRGSCFRCCCFSPLLSCGGGAVIRYTHRRLLRLQTRTSTNTCAAYDFHQIKRATWSLIPGTYKDISEGALWLDIVEPFGRFPPPPLFR